MPNRLPGGTGGGRDPRRWGKRDTIPKGYALSPPQRWGKRDTIPKGYALSPPPRWGKRDTIPKGYALSPPQSSGAVWTGWWWSSASRPRMSVDILGTNCDQCRSSTVQCCFTSTETVRLIRTESPGRPPRLSHNSWTLCEWGGGPGLSFLIIP